MTSKAEAVFLSVCGLLVGIGIILHVWRDLVKGIDGYEWQRQD